MKTALIVVGVLAFWMLLVKGIAKFCGFNQLDRDNDANAIRRDARMTPTQQDRSRKWRQSPKGKYAEQKRRARERGVGFLLTYDQWWGIWTLSGKWDKRGNTRGRYCMCRKGDAGAYEVGNVYIGTWSQNTVKRNRVVAAKRHTARSTAVAFTCTCSAGCETCCGF